MTAEFNYLLSQVDAPDRLTARLERLLLKVPNHTLGTPCYLWTGGVKRNGYGFINVWTPRFKGDRRVSQLMVHRLFLTLRLARPIAPDMDCAHACHERTCVSHVYEATRQDNLKDRDARQKMKVPF